MLSYADALAPVESAMPVLSLRRRAPIEIP
jgi:hypothetical protein